MRTQGARTVGLVLTLAWTVIPCAVPGTHAEAAQGASLRSAPKGGLGRAYQVRLTPFPFGILMSDIRRA